MTGQPTSGRRPGTELDRRFRAVLTAEAEGRAPDRILEGVFAQTQVARQARRWPWAGLGGVAMQWRARAILFASALAVVAIGTILATAGAPFHPPPASPTASPLATIPPPFARVCSGGTGLASRGTTLWVACPGGIERIDIAAPTSGGDVLLPDVGLPIVGPAGVFALAPAGVVELDAAGGIRRTLPATGLTVLAVGDSVLWGTGSDRILRAISTADGTEVARVSLTATPLAIIEAGGDVWVGLDDGTVRRFHGAGLDLAGSFATGLRPSLLATGSGAVYALSTARDGRLTRINLTDGRTTTAVVADPTDPAGLDFLAADDQGVWIARRTSLVRVDPLSLALGGSIGLPAYPVSVILDGTQAWVYGEGRIDRIVLP